MDLANTTWEEANPRDFVVRRELSLGPHSAVVQAVDPVSHRQVAVKAGTRQTDRTASAIVREAEILSRLEHPNIARLIGLEYANRSAILLTEFVSGPTLGSHLASDVDRTASHVVELIVQLCEAVSAVHKAGFVHGDISASNVLVAPDDRLVLIDFGESRPCGAPSVPARATPDFAAPELSRGAPASVASDVYSLGMLVSLMALSLPVRGMAHESGSTLLEIIERATQSDPSRRYDTVEEILSAVQRLTRRTGG